MNHYKVGYKAVIEIDKVFEQDGEKLYRANGMKSLVFDDNELNILKSLEGYTYKIGKQAAEITRLLAENAGLKEQVRLLRRQPNPKDNAEREAGQNEAWELARKIVDDVWNGGYSEGKLKQIFGYAISQLCIVKNTYQEAAAKVAEWERAKEEVKVGDVYMSRVGNYFVIYDIDHEKGIAKILWSDLSNSARELDDIKEYYIKTGRHIDIDSFLKQIGEEE